MGGAGGDVRTGDGMGMGKRRGRMRVTRLAVQPRVARITETGERPDPVVAGASVETHLASALVNI